MVHPSLTKKEILIFLLFIKLIQITYIKKLRKCSISLKSIKEKESILKREPKGESLTRRSSTFQKKNSGFLGNIKKGMHNESKKCFKKVIFSLNKNLEIVIRKKKNISTNIIKFHQMWSENSPEEEKNIQKKNRSSFHLSQKQKMNF